MSAIDTARYQREFKSLEFSEPTSGVLEIVLSKGPINAADARMHRDLALVWRVIDTDVQVRVALVRGAGEHFSAGGDYKLIEEMIADDAALVRVWKEASDLDVMLPDGTEDAEYLDRLDAALDVVMARHDPQFVFYLAGADPFAGDRLGRLALSLEGLRTRDRLVFDRFSTVPIAACMGGGYCPDVETIVTIHANTIRELQLSELCRHGNGNGKWQMGNGKELYTQQRAFDE